MIYIFKFEGAAPKIYGQGLGPSPSIMDSSITRSILAILTVIFIWMRLVLMLKRSSAQGVDQQDTVHHMTKMAFSAVTGSSPSRKADSEFMDLVYGEKESEPVTSLASRGQSRLDSLTDEELVRRATQNRRNEAIEASIAKTRQRAGAQKGGFGKRRAFN